MRSRFALMWGMVCLGFAADCRGQSAPNFQKGETILAADKAPADAPLRRTEKFPWYQLSNLRKGGGKAGRVPSPLAEFSIDYVRDDGVSPGSSIVLVARTSAGRKEYSSWGPFTPFADKSDTVTAESTFSPFSKRVGDDFEVWLESVVYFEGKSFRFKVSNSVSVGNIGQLTMARQWNEKETTGIARWEKSNTPPPAPPAGQIAVSAETKLVAGMPLLAGWMAAWEPAEVIDVRKDGQVLIKFNPETSPGVILRQRSWLAVESKVLESAKKGTSKFSPSVKVLANGLLPLDEELEPLAKNVKLYKGVPLRMEWGNKWSPVTVVKEMVDGRVRIHWDEWKGHPDEEKPREILAISTETLAQLNEPDAKEKFAARAEEAAETEGTFGGKPADAPRQLKQYPITIAIPKSAAKVTEDTPLEEGTKLGCSWGSRWHDVTVMDVYDDGVVRIHWDKFGDAWDGDMSRDCLIIEKKVLAKLNAKKPKSPSKPDKVEEKPVPRAASTEASAKGGCQLVLNGYGKSKFPVVKVVMEITGLDLNDAKELVETAPIPLKQSISKTEAEKLRKKIIDAGGDASVEEK